MPIIDTHAHVFPADFGPAPPGCDPAAWPSVEDSPDPDTKLLVNGPMRFPARRIWFDAEQRLEASAASGLDAELLSPFPALLNYRVPGPLGRDLCRVTNEYIAGLVAAYPAKFHGLGTIPLQDPDLGTAELAEIAKLGLSGIEIASNINGVSLHDPQLDGFWAEAERLGTAVFIHGMPVASDRVPGPAVATFGVGNEMTLGAASVIAGGIAEKYPNLKISFSHAAGGFALVLSRAQWFWGRTWNEEPPLPERERPEAAPWFGEHSPIELARRFYYDSLVFDRRAIRYLADMLGTDRLLVGSDYPAMTREQPIARTLRSMGLSQAELDDVLWNNCFRFLGIDPPKLSGPAYPGHGFRGHGFRDRTGRLNVGGTLPTWICATCGNHYPDSAAPPKSCVICTDERQWVPPSGQRWTTRAELAGEGRRCDIWPEEPGLFGLGVTPAVGIGQRGLIVTTGDGNLLWDPPGYLDGDAIERVRQLGGLSAVTASHPHFYGAMAEWGQEFGADVWVPEADAAWVTRPDPAIRTWRTRLPVLPGVTLIQCGGHFPGSAVVHWAAGADGAGALLTGDTIFVTPGEDRLTFVWSAPNRLPLPEASIRGILAALQADPFDRIYGGWAPTVRSGARAALDASAGRYIQFLRGEAPG